MSKTKTTVPVYTNSAISINSKPKSSTKFNGSVVNANYQMTDDEKKAYEYAQKDFADNLKNINVFSEDVLNDLNNQVEAYKQQGIKTIKEVYSPILRDLQNDMSSRFGNIDNSIFLDKLSNIESKRAESINTLAQDVETKKQELINNELTNRYNYLNFLNNYQNSVFQNALSALGLNNSISSGVKTAEISNDYGLNDQLSRVMMMAARMI